MWPEIVDLNIGESFQLSTAQGPRTITLRAVENMIWAPDYWIEGNPSNHVLISTDVVVEVSGELAVLKARPFELPQVVNGVRLYVEFTQFWAGLDTHVEVHDLHKAVQLSVRDASLPWGPAGLAFPIRDYRWRAASYANTWSALVPYNLHYYHRGEDFGAIPDLLDVLCLFDGEVVTSPCGVAKGSNTLLITGEGGVSVAYAHMNVETIDPGLVPGTRVRAGQVLGKTGCTWNGFHAQTHDPHLHVSFHRRSELATVQQRGDPLSAFPFLVQAYFDAYPEDVLPIAGGYRFVDAGGTLTLDAAHTLTRPGTPPPSYTWILHDGSRVEGAQAQLTCPRPGLYSEMLLVRDAQGREDADFCQVRVWDPAIRTNIARGWAFYHPLRGIRPGTPVLFWNRLSNTRGAVHIDFGDGSPRVEIGDEISHAYTRPGLHVVTLEGQGPGGEPIQVRMRVYVEGGAR